MLLNFLNIPIYVKTVTSFWSPASSVYRAAASPPLGNGYFSTLIVFLISQRLRLMISSIRRDADTSFHIFLWDEVLWRMSHQLRLRLMQIAHKTCLSVILLAHNYNVFGISCQDILFLLNHMENRQAYEKWISQTLLAIHSHTARHISQYCKDKSVQKYVGFV